jgi:hypothetical protein
MQTDVVYFHVFNDLLKDGRWDFRWSIGPAFHFGGNIHAAKSVLSRDTSAVPSQFGPLQPNSSHSNP